MAEKETTDINKEYDMDNYDDGKIYSLKKIRHVGRKSTRAKGSKIAFIYGSLDETTGDGGLGIGSLVTFSDPRQDPYLSVPDGKNDENFDLESNSDLEDIKIKPTDNLVLVGHVEGNASILEVYGELTGF